MRYRFRVSEIINNYRHRVVLPDFDCDGKRVENKETVLSMLKKGQFEFFIF